MSDDRRVDDLRQQLRALGYLDAGVDRFVLGPARSARSPWTIAALSSLRVGALAAVLLGPVVAAGIGARLPGLVTGPRDAVVVALYLAVMFGVTATLFTFVASVLVATVGRRAVATRARSVSRAAGTVVGLACLAYLTLWWQSANATAAWSAPTWTALALLVAVIVSLLLGHAVAITTFAVIAARHPAHVTATAAPAASTRWLVIAAGLFAFVGAAGLLVVAAPRENDAGAAQPQLPVVSPGVRVLVVGIDGFDPEVFNTLRTAGRVPGLTAMFARGRARVAADESHDPARTWTTIATGQPPEVHGVHTLETRRVAGLGGAVTTGDETGVRRAVRGATDLLRLTRPSIASGGELRAKPFWEVASQAGLRVVVVNWWATWPATAGTGAVVLSDRATLRLEHGGELNAEITPRETYDHLRPLWAAIKSDAASITAKHLPAVNDTVVAASLRRSAEIDALQLMLMTRLPGPPGQHDLYALYLPGLDILQHTLLGSGESLSASAVSARLDAVQAYYVFLDQLLSDVLRPEHEMLCVLVTQPGRLQSHSAGLVAVAGNIAAASVGADLRPVDVAPTILYALGVPISRELSGKPALQLFDPAFVSKFPVREVPTYGPRRPQGAVREGKPLDDEMVERLRSLGYVR
jgi:hypothetical protein